MGGCCCNWVLWPCLHNVGVDLVAAHVVSWRCSESTGFHLHRYRNVRECLLFSIVVKQARIERHHSRNSTTNLSLPLTDTCSSTHPKTPIYLSSQIFTYTKYPPPSPPSRPPNAPNGTATRASSRARTLIAIRASCAAVSDIMGLSVLYLYVLYLILSHLL